MMNFKVSGEVIFLFNCDKTELKRSSKICFLFPNGIVRR